MVGFNRELLSQLKVIIVISILAFSFSSEASTVTPIGLEFKVGGEGDVVRQGHSIAPLTDGGYVIAWYQSFPERSVFAQRYDLHDQPIGNEWKVSTAEVEEGNNPQAVGLKNGGFTIIWNQLTDIGFGTSYGLFRQEYDSEGLPIGDIKLMAAQTGTSVSLTSAAPISGGGFVVAWEEAPVGLERVKIWLQRYSAEGPLIGEGTVYEDTPILKQEDTAAVTGLDNDFYAVASVASEINGVQGIITLALHAADDYPMVFTKVNDHNSLISLHTPLSLKRLSDGKLLVSWSGPTDSGTNTSYFRLFNEQGDPINEVTTVASHSISVDASPLSNGGFVLVWDEDLGGVAKRDIHGRTYDRNGQIASDIFKVNSDPSGEQVSPLAIPVGQNEFVTVWNESNTGSLYTRRHKLEDGASQAPKMEIDGIPNVLYVGQEVTLNVNVTGQNIYGMDAVLASNSPVNAKFSGAEYGDFFADFERIGMPSSVSDSQWQGALSLMAPAIAKSGSGTFATVTLTGVEAGTVTLTLDSQITDPNGVLLLDKRTNYSLEIKEALKVKGSLADFGLSTVNESVKVFVNGKLITVAADGTFEASATPGEIVIRIEAEGFLPAEKTLQLSFSDTLTDLGNIVLVGGDSNGDERIDNTDLAMLQDAYRSTKVGGFPYTPSLDFNRDERINLQDLTILGRNYGKSGGQSW
ncbi:dockerin type I domain-containing protein [Pseudoalteromonas sp. T1lg65]|uniref:dockerin type I domain-containing protein n=1 Tax=Pseudoalteromonas sp. T1lg65 TaxID=2077101 RepID=UPI003F7A21BF